MADTVEDMLREATAAGASLVSDGTLARTARYDAGKAELHITLTNGTSAPFPPT